MGIQTTIDRVGAVLGAISALADRQVLVGIPASRGVRREGQITNAAIGYIMENGSPARGIPARPFLNPTVKAMRPQIAEQLRNAGSLALSGNQGATEKTLMGLGIMVSQAVKNAIDAGIPPPLARSTLLGRIRNRTAIKGAKAELKHRDAGGIPGLDLAKPLVATGQLRNAITYVIRSRTGRLLGFNETSNDLRTNQVATPFGAAPNQIGRS
jgi:hypothetical protein